MVREVFEALLFWGCAMFVVMVAGRLVRRGADMFVPHSSGDTGGPQSQVPGAEASFGKH
jgi:hypothetical protein